MPGRDRCALSPCGHLPIDLFFYLFENLYQKSNTKQQQNKLQVLSRNICVKWQNFRFCCWCWMSMISWMSFVLFVMLSVLNFGTEWVARCLCFWDVFMLKGNFACFQPTSIFTYLWSAALCLWAQLSFFCLLYHHLTKNAWNMDRTT